MRSTGPGWRKIPFVKLIAAFICGIINEYYFSPSPDIWLAMLLPASVTVLAFFFIPYFQRFKNSPVSGVSGFAIFVALGALLVIQHRIESDPQWVGNFTGQHGYVRARIIEPPVEKNKTYQLLASAQLLVQGDEHIPLKGKFFIYLKKQKDPIPQQVPGYGATVLFANELSEIKGIGNPGSFDYGAYCRMKGITHQVFLGKEELLDLNEKKTNSFHQLIFSLRERIVVLIKKYIHGKKESGLAEALLIGYKQDLDKSLVKDYADTGVVHIIAISGLHVGLIYWLLNLLFSPLKRSGKFAWLSVVLTISGLWFFSFLSGAQPSILRAALMFSCMAIETQVSGKRSTYNTIAFSAFVLLIIDPYWLWDAGFQLSYAAVISIIAFMKPIYGLFYFRNRIADLIWKMNAVTISAQVLTVPVCIYYFQQFPLYFLLTNFIAVPLSTAILFGEILLIALAVTPFLATLLGKCLRFSIQFLNECIALATRLPFATWESLLFTVEQALILSMFALAAGFGLIERSRFLLKVSGICLLLFMGLRLHSFYGSSSRNAIIIYNVPGHRALDLVEGRRFRFIGDSIFFRPTAEREFFLDPCRTYFRISPAGPGLDTDLLEFQGKKIWLIHGNSRINYNAAPVPIDLLVLSGSPRLYLTSLAKNTRIRQVVMDGSVPEWKSRYWKKDCDSLQIPWHDVSIAGAFEMNLR